MSRFFEKVPGVSDDEMDALHLVARSFVERHGTEDLPTTANPLLVAMERAHVAAVIIARSEAPQTEVGAPGGLGRSRRRSLAAQLAELYGWVCDYCDKALTPETATIDHMTAGQDHDLENLTLACRPCNASKGRKSVTEFVIWRRYRWPAVEVRS